MTNSFKRSVLLLALTGALAIFYLPHNQGFSTATSRTPSPTTAFRDLFGDAERGGKMASLWFERSFKDGADNAYVMFFATEKADQSGCQVCAVDIAAITNKQVAGRWQVTSKQRKFGESVMGGVGTSHSGLKIADVSAGRL